MTHPSHELYELIQQFDRFPDGVTSIPRQLQGTSFFPAGIGLLSANKDKEIPEFPFGGVMVLAHDWGTVGDFEAYAKHDEESLNNPTWRNMLSFLYKVGIDPKECFFTNFFVGLRSGDSSVGKFPGADAPDYVKRCQHFLLQQLDKQKPKLVLVLGAHVPKFISTVLDEMAPWKKFGSFKTIDAQNLALIRDVRLRNANHRFSVVSLVHPCYRQINAKSRQWNGLAGDAAEVGLVKHALAYVKGMR